MALAAELFAKTASEFGTVKEFEMQAMSAELAFHTLDSERDPRLVQHFYAPTAESLEYAKDAASAWRDSLEHNNDPITYMIRLCQLGMYTFIGRQNPISIYNFFKLSRKFNAAHGMPRIESYDLLHMAWARISNDNSPSLKLHWQMADNNIQNAINIWKELGAHEEHIAQAQMFLDSARTFHESAEEKPPEDMYDDPMGGLGM